MIKRNCLVCEKIFNTCLSAIKYGKGKYCSKKCFHNHLKSKNPKIKINCSFCKKIIYRTLSRVKNNKKMNYCSKKCENNYWKSKNPKIRKKCLVCKKIFITSLSKIKEGKGNFCSRKCFYKGQIGHKCSEKTRRKLSETRKKNKTKNGYLNSPQQRLKSSIAHKGQIPWNKGKKCSEKMLKHLKLNAKNLSENSAFKKSRRQEGNPNWRGGTTPFRTRIWGSSKYRQWRQDVYIRDNFTCQKCGNKGCYLEAHHHKKSFKQLVEEAKEHLPLLDLYSAVMMYAPMWDLKWGQTLCEKCHNKTKKNKTDNA